MTAADTVREALDRIADDLSHWGEPGATYDAHSVDDALAALDALQAEAEEGANWKASCARYLAARQAAEAERDRLAAQAEEAVGAIQEMWKAQESQQAAEAERDEIAGTLGRKAALLEGVATERDRQKARADALGESLDQQMGISDNYKAERDWLADALKFYADEDNWEGTAGEGTASIVDDDMGDTARAALDHMEQA